MNTYMYNIHFHDKIYPYFFLGLSEEFHSRLIWICLQKYLSLSTGLKKLTG